MQGYLAKMGKLRNNSSTTRSVDNLQPVHNFKHRRRLHFNFIFAKLSLFFQFTIMSAKSWDGSRAKKRFEDRGWQTGMELKKEKITNDVRKTIFKIWIQNL